MIIETVDLPIENGGSFHSYVSLPEGTLRDIHSMGLLENSWQKIPVIMSTPD